MDLGFGGVVGPRQGEPSGEGAQVVLLPTGEAGQLRAPAVSGLGAPDHSAKGLNQAIGSRNAYIHPAELVDIRLCLNRALGGGADDGGGYGTGRRPLRTGVR
jgi:hypothetical protein